MGRVVCFSSSFDGVLLLWLVRVRIERAGGQIQSAVSPVHALVLPAVLLGTSLCPDWEDVPALGPAAVVGNLVTVLHVKFWHSCGGAIHLLARHPARAFQERPY